MKVITILEARISPENWDVLEHEFKAGTEHIPPQLVQSFLVHNAKDPELWRIISVWRSREALEEMRRTEGTPAGILMFRAAGAEPILSLFDVTAQVGQGMKED